MLNFTYSDKKIIKDTTNNSTKEVKEILDNTKLKEFNKNQCVLSLDEIKKIDELLSK